MPRIVINGNALDPIDDGPTLSAVGLRSANAANSNYILIQSDGNLTAGQMHELADKGVRIQEYVGDYTYLCKYEPTDLAVLESLPFVNWANVYVKDFKIAADLKSEGAAANATMDIFASRAAPVNHLSRTLHEVDITFHEDVDPQAGDIKSAVAAAAHIDADTLHVWQRHARLNVQRRHLRALADIDAVARVEKVRPFKLMNDKAREILHVGESVDGNVYSGSGQVVCVADTGFDVGKTDGSIHPAFKGRVKKLYALGRDETNRADDPQGHGTHVCGSVLGDGSSKTLGVRIQGTAPSADLVMQSVMASDGSLSGIPKHLGKLFKTPYENDNARVHSNSWGPQMRGEQYPYDAAAAQIDEFVWEHPDMVICFAAGNDGADGPEEDGKIDQRQIGSSSSAKNNITVGASENLRPQAELNADYPTWGALMGVRQSPLKNDYVADNPNGMAAFSSRGPTKENRIKPDVVAPGSAILSARSRRAPKPAETAFGTCADPDWFYDSGTSMATPLVAGCCAVIREFLVKNGSQKSPSAALVKAVLINGATDLIGQYVPSEAGPSPNFNSGFGRVNMANSTLTEGNMAGFGEGGPLKQDENYSFSIPIPEVLSASSNNITHSLNISMVWTDPPGPVLQNNLNMTVTASDGVKKEGNEGMERINNVQKLTWKAIPPGPATVNVAAHVVLPEKAQKFAFAWRITQDK